MLYISAKRSFVMPYMSENNIAPCWDQFPLGIRAMARGRNHELNFHDHRFSEIVLILYSGGAVHWAEGKSHQLERGDVLLLHPGNVHAYENTGKLELVNLLYKADKLPLPLLDGNGMEIFRFLISPCQPDAPPPELPVVHLEEEPLRKIETLIAELEDEQKKRLPGRNLRCLILFMNILILIGRSGRAATHDEEPNPAAAALAYLNTHFREQVSIAHLARLSRLSGRSLFRRFRELTGRTPLEYRSRKQLEHAADLLRGSNLSLKAVAQECGYCDTNHLIRRFSAHFGMPPGTFRKLLRSDETQPAASRRQALT